MHGHLNIPPTKLHSPAGDWSDRSSSGRSGTEPQISWSGEQKCASMIPALASISSSGDRKAVERASLQVHGGATPVDDLKSCSLHSLSNPAGVALGPSQADLVPCSHQRHCAGPARSELIAEAPRLFGSFSRSRLGRQSNIGRAGSLNNRAEVSHDPRDGENGRRNASSQLASQSVSCRPWR